MIEPGRRKRRRFYLSLPLVVRLWKQWEDSPRPLQKPPTEENTLTENISSGGCCFQLSYRPTVGSEVEMEITIPIRSPLGIPNRVRCHGKVTRVEEDHSEGRVGVVATIESYQFLDSLPDSAPEILPC